ncbi:hypothetical protein B7R74_21715 [Yersinia pseudotuberculosis]|nr:hypothetical protein B7R74_21715 [Yersinia pseudotuberculosis]
MHTPAAVLCSKLCTYAPPLLPPFVRECRSLKQFWGFIKPKIESYANRINYINEEFLSLFDYLEGKNTSPGSRSGNQEHFAQLVKDWVFVTQIKLHYLSPYSPNLNAIERLWKVINNNRYFEKRMIFAKRYINFSAQRFLK